MMRISLRAFITLGDLYNRCCLWLLVGLLCSLLLLLFLCLVMLLLLFLLLVVVVVLFYVPLSHMHVVSRALMGLAVVGVVVVVVVVVFAVAVAVATEKYDCLRECIRQLC
ncbi:unnamed protein product [Polarella glacialis]|uniref:Uncharacterized protein n=1 Tax=Polarella glacialis TaxID=89957 RepID=A0A813KWQ7_POLGL|nr:unnamed protein product [Polarella glacialis]